MKAPAQVPKLRFPGFEGEWEQAELGTLAEIKLGKMLDKAKHTSGRLLPYLNNISLRWNEVDTSNLPQMHFDDDELERFGLKAGDVVVCEGGEPGRAAVWDGRLPDLKFQKAIHRVRFKVPFEPRLLVLYLENIAGTTKFEMLFTGGGIKHLTRETFAALKVPLISYPEQQKIAAFLTAVDGRIEQLSRKKALLEATKKGVMQQLFTQTLRFQDDHGHDFPDWEEKTLGEIGTITTGKTPSTSDALAWKGETMFVTPTDIGEDTKYQSKTARHVNGSKLRLIPANSLMFTCIASVGKMSIATAPCITNQQINSVTVRPELSYEFIYYALRYMTPQIKATQANTTLPIINKTEFSKFVLPSPSLPEQTKIASFLSALDGKIGAVGEQMRQTQAWKKGLLQQMFV